MASLQDKKERERLRQYAESVAVDREIQNRGRMELDKAVSDVKKLEGFYQKEIELKKELLELLKQTNQYGMNDSTRKRVLHIQQQLKHCKAPQGQTYEKIETQDIHHSYEEMRESNIAFAKKYDVDLSNPFMAMFSNVEQEIISRELAEKFDLLRLDKYDYAFAAGVGIIGGVVDILLVGTATTKKEERKGLVKLTDDAANMAIQKFAKMNGWPGPREGKDATRSAIGYLEGGSERKFNQFRVNYDANKSKDIKDAVKGMYPSNHHLISIAHSPSLLGLVVGILDILQGKTTLVDPQTGKIVRVAGDKMEDVKGIVDAVSRWFGHLMSDVGGSSGAVERGSGLPTPMQTVLQMFQFGKIPMKEDGVTGETIYGTMGQITVKMFENGFDLRFSAATAIPVIVCEVIIRLYWFCKQHFYYGYNRKESIPMGKKRELQRLLLITSSSFAAIDVAQAIVKGYGEQNPITFLNSINYVQLANMGYKLWVNFRLEHEHNEKVRELIQGQIHNKWQELVNAQYAFAEQCEEEEKRKIHHE